MKPMQRYLIPLIVLAALALGAIGVAFAREMSGPEIGSTTSQEIEFTGVVDKIDGNTWTIAGRTVLVDISTELKNFISVGQQVKVHASMDTNGSLVASEIELTDNTSINDANANEDLGEDANEDVNDDAFEEDDANDNAGAILDNANANANDNSDDEQLDENSNDNSSFLNEDNSNNNSSLNEDNSNDNSSIGENDNSQSISHDDGNSHDDHQGDQGGHDGSGHDGGDDHGDD